MPGALAGTTGLSWLHSMWGLILHGQTQAGCDAGSAPREGNHGLGTNASFLPPKYVAKAGSP